MKPILTILTAVAALTLGACVNSSGGYSVKAYAPKNPAAVRVKVSRRTTLSVPSVVRSRGF